APVTNPLYGFHEADGVTGEAQYKPASYLDDTHSIKWNMQRLSETVRALDSKIGSHPNGILSSTFQAISPKAIAEKTSDHSIENKYNNFSTDDFVIKSGNVGWFQPNVGDIDQTRTDDYGSYGTTTLGDSHHTALIMLDRTLDYIYTDRLGLTGNSYSASLSRNDIYDLNKTGFVADQELWLNTSLSGGDTNRRTFKDVTSLGLSNKLHRDNGYVTTWLHFGTDTSYERKYSPELSEASWTGLFSASGDANYYTPVHIGSEGVIVQTTQGGQQWGLFAGMDQTAYYSYGIMYETYGDRYQRSSILGGKALNLSSRQHTDVLLSVSGSPSLVIGDIGKEIEINYKNAGPANTISGTITSVVNNNNAYARLYNRMPIFDTHDGPAAVNDYRFIPEFYTGFIASDYSSITIDGGTYA
ncbi:unnamed protein product, partial [marine sediment metagenome]